MRHGFRNSCPNNICKKNPVRKPKQKTGYTGKKGQKWENTYRLFFSETLIFTSN